MKDDYSVILEKYNLLLKENKKLKAELALLKDKAGLAMPETETTPQISISSINKHSSPEEKINLFRSLFKGREDVFARRWYSKTLDKSGYQPVCENEWNEEFCDKKKYKCSTCPNRKLMALTDKDIYRHLSGKDPFGRDVADGESVLKNLSDSFDELISWAELYDESSFEKKKMIVNCLIKRVEVCRGYKLKVEFNIDFEQFMVGLDKVA